MDEGKVDEYPGYGGKRDHWTVTILWHVDTKVNPRDRKHIGKQVEQDRFQFRHSVLQINCESAWKK